MAHLLMHGALEVKDARGMTVIRPNKIAAGMTKAHARNRHKLDGDVLTLQVKGTLDILGRLIFGISKRTQCKCCGANTGPLVLNDRGRLKLNSLRRRKAARA